MTGAIERGTPIEQAFNNGDEGQIPMFSASMTFDLGDDIGALRDVVHSWAQTRLAPMAADIDLDNIFPAQLWSEMGDLGLLGITVPDTFGGAEMAYLATRSPSKKSRGPPRPWRCPMVRTPTSV